MRARLEAARAALAEVDAIVSVINQGGQRIPVGDARELPEQEALRALRDVFGVLEDPITQAMPLRLELQPTPESEFASMVRRVFGATA